MNSMRTHYDGKQFMNLCREPYAIHMILRISLKSDFINPPDDLFRYNDAQLEPTDNEDDPNLLVQRESFKANRKMEENLTRKSTNTFQNQPGLKRFSRSAGKTSSMQTHFVDQTKGNFHAEDSRIPKAEISTGNMVKTKTKLIKNMVYVHFTMK